MSDLRHGWATVFLADLVDVLDNRRIPVSGAERAKRHGNVPYYGATGQVGCIDEAIFDEDLVLLGEDGVAFLDASKSKAYAISGPSWVNNHAHVLRADPRLLDQRYLLHYLNYFDYQGYATGTTRLKLTKSAMCKIPVYLPPLTEQRRIVAALDTYLSALNAGLSYVSWARRRVAELWQSTLNRGTSGQGHAKDWPMSSLGQLSHGGGYGTSVKCSYDGQGVAVVRIPNILDGEVDLTDMKYATDPAVDLSGLYLSVGDILFVRTNGSRSLIGRTAVADKADVDVAFASYLIRFRLRTEVVRPRWVHHVLQGSVCRRRLEREAASSAGQYNLSLAKLESIQIPIPRLSEQDSILAELNDQRCVNDRLGASLGVVEVGEEALRRSLLADAFSGRLAPQDPNDEPAGALLARIRAERVAQLRVKRARRTAKNVNSGQESML